jgi:hypothetical protein
VHKGRPSPLSFRLDIRGAWHNEDETGLALQIRLSSQDPSGVQDVSGNIPSVYLDETVSVTPVRRLLSVSSFQEWSAPFLARPVRRKAFVVQ